MICTHCGKEHVGNFCHSCGKRIAIRRPFQVPKPIQSSVKKYEKPLSITIMTPPSSPEIRPIQARSIQARSIQVIRPVQARSIQARSIQARSIQARSIQARSIQARSIQARSIQVIRPVQARSIQARSIQTRSIQARSIQARSIQARSIQAIPVQARSIQKTRLYSAPQTYKVPHLIQETRRTKCIKCESKHMNIKIPINQMYLCSKCFNHPDCKWYECIENGCSIGFPAIENYSSCPKCWSLRLI
jgi:hypothetical protein